jgi:hypothetical protein
LFFLFFFFFSGTALASDFSGGAGTSGDPYQITTPTELNNVRNYLGSGNSGKYFKVMNDIDLNVAPYNTGSGFVPIGANGNAFYGKFDGGSKIISNLFMSRAGSDYTGLFGYAESGSTFQNVYLEDVNVSGYEQTGALIGRNYGQISKS